MEKKYFLQRADELKQIFGKLKFFHLRQDEKPSIFDNMKVLCSIFVVLVKIKMQIQ